MTLDTNLMLRSQDQQRYETWAKNPTQENMRSVLDNLNPLIQREVNRWQGTLARPYLETQGKKLAVQAIRSFQPSRGVQLSTHVTNQLQKLSRPSYTYQKSARIPEHRLLKVVTFEGVRGRLADSLGRDPTADELAQELAWGLPEVQRLLRESRRELTAEVETADEQETHTDPLVQYVYHDLTPLQQKIFEMKTGYMGGAVFRPAQIKKKLGLSQGQLSYQQDLIVNRFNAVQGGVRDV